MRTRWIDRVALANDASVYRLVPRAVVHPESIPEIQALLAFSREARIPLTFRAAGTSLSGQAVTDGILVVLSRHWRGVWIEDDGRRVRVEPGVRGGEVNERLRPHGRKIGPDPASIHSCMMGGILANNSSGMCCGVEQNAYRTLRSMVFVLPDGTVVDGERPDADERLRREAPRIVAGLEDLRRRVLADPALSARIAAKYRLKNTMGYSLNALLDFERPVEILSHLMIGSEGTLGFIARAVLETVPDYPLRSTGLLFFPGVFDACAAIGALRESGARALELMDRASLRAIARQGGAPAEMGTLSEEAAALLVEYQCETQDELAAGRAAAQALLPSLPLLAPAEFTLDPERQAVLWRLRRGLIASVGAMRRPNTSFILEDVVFPPARLAQGVSELRELLADWGYDDAIVFGHARDGNLHFVLTQAFDRPDEVERYDGFMRRLATLVAGRYDGALKAEHGTGRNMAPFVRAEWGPAAFAIMQELKRLIDPDGLLNPGVVLNDDPRAHVTHLKDLPVVEAEVDACIECGFCERMCPSRDLTLTPRQRIVVRREMARLAVREPASAVLDELARHYRHDGLDTCAADGMCALACPVGIDTGALVKRLRQESHAEPVQELARQLATRFALTESGARTALRLGHGLARLVGHGNVAALARVGRAVLGRAVPFWDGTLPPAARPPRAGTARAAASAVLFPSCASRIFAADGDGAPLADRIARVAARAGAPLHVPADASGICCGLLFSSKGWHLAAADAANRSLERLWDWSDDGRLPVVVDASPCALALATPGDGLTPENRERLERLTILDGVEFARSLLARGLRPRKRSRRIVLHPVCSLHRRGLVAALEEIGRACADEVAIPLGAGCCGFAGDRGLRFPELTAAATRQEAAEVRALDPDGCFSSSRTCEIGLSRAAGRPYRSFWTLLE